MNVPVSDLGLGTAWTGCWTGSGCSRSPRSPAQTVDTYNIIIQGYAS